MIGCISISLDALVRNARALRDLVAPAQAAFVVKSNAYGHGAVPVARALERITPRLCVYSASEALALQEAGITSTLFVMGPVEPAELDALIESGIEFALWDTGSYLDDVEAAAARHKRPARVHAKIDTGISRLGVSPQRAPEALARIARSSAVALTGIFSHLAAAEELDSPFTMTQIDRFNAALASAQPALRDCSPAPLRHIAASAAAMLWPQTRLDMVRIGIALYGLWPSEQTRAAMNGAALDLRPALSFQTRLVCVREVGAGTPIGYGCSYHAPKATRIGVVPLGYADGIPRLLSNCGAFLVAGKRAPIVGRICMNMTMIDLGADSHAHAGEPVTLIGSQGEAAVGVDDWARWSQSINYEIVARLPGELSRAFDSLPV